MCMMCDGASRDEVRFYIHGVISLKGWAVIPVEGRSPDRNWAYTIGLAAFDHPELVIVGGDVVGQADVLNRLGEQVEAGERFEAGQRAPYGGLEIELIGVHPVQLERGLVNFWWDYYSALGPALPELDVVQVLLPPDRCCALHQFSQVRLDDPTTTLSGFSPNRASRRARRRRPRRGPHTDTPG